MRKIGSATGNAKTKSTVKYTTELQYIIKNLNLQWSVQELTSETEVTSKRATFISRVLTTELRSSGEISTLENTTTANKKETTGFAQGNSDSQNTSTSESDTLVYQPIEGSLIESETQQFPIAHQVDHTVISSVVIYTVIFLRVLGLHVDSIKPS